MTPESATDKMVCGHSGEGHQPEQVNPDMPWLWLCGCLINDGHAHRVRCPDFPEGRR